MPVALQLLVFFLAAAVSLATSYLLVTRLERIGERLGLSEALLGMLAALAADAPEITSAVTALAQHQQKVGAGVIIGSNVFNLAALLGLGGVVAGSIALHRRVVLLGGVIALWVAVVCLVTTTGTIPPAAGLVAVLAILVPYLVLLGVGAARLHRVPVARRWESWLAVAISEEEQELEEIIHPAHGRRPDVWLAVVALVVVVAASVVMERAGTSIGTHFGVPQIVTGGVVLAAVTSLPNAVAAVYLAIRGRGAAMLSTTLNSNALNVAAGLLLPAAVRPLLEAPIFSRANGYLKRWLVDIGAHVEAGQLLAEIDTPEVDQQLHQSRADLATAEANVHLAQITAERYSGLLKTDSVSKQDADNAESDYTAKKTIVQSSQANVKRLEDLQSFQRIYAPFDGVITARNTDIGALIDPGSSGGTRTELFHIAQPGRLRVYVNVPEAYSQAAKPGLTADLTLTEFPGRRFQGTLVRTADAIDPATRTLLVEIAVNNPSGELLTGAYAEVHLKLPSPKSSLILPVDTLIFRSEGLRVVVVNNGKAELRPITLGHDFGSEVEVVDGLTGDEAVVINPPDSIETGQEVRVVAASQAGGGQ